MSDPKSHKTTAELMAYLAAQQAQGWPGSKSIRGRPVTTKEKR